MLVKRHRRTDASGERAEKQVPRAESECNWRGYTKGVLGLALAEQDGEMETDGSGTSRFELRGTQLMYASGTGGKQLNLNRHSRKMLRAFGRAQKSEGA